VVSAITAVKLSVTPTTTKTGMYFAGWYETPNFSGEPIVIPYYSEEDTTLYAKWSDTKIADGASMMTAYPILVGQVLDCNIQTYDQRIFFEFIPTVSATYNIVSYGAFDTYCWIYNSEGVELDAADSGGTGENFLISEYLEVGQTYYIEACMYYEDDYGLFTISVNPQPS